MPTTRTTPLQRTEPTLIDDILKLPTALDQQTRDHIHHYAGGVIARLAVGTSIRDYFALNAKAIRRDTVLALTEAGYNDLANAHDDIATAHAGPEFWTERGNHLLWAAQVLAGVDGDNV